jgi:cyclase
MEAMSAGRKRSRSDRLLLALLTIVVFAGIPGQGHARQDQDFDDIEIKVLHVQGNIYMLVGAGGNITLQVGEEGVLIVDSMYAELADKVLATIRGLSGKPIRYLISTHFHPDHIGGNATIAQAGSNIAAGNVLVAIADAGETAKIIAHENVLTAMSTQEPAPPFESWPTDTFFTSSKEVYFNGEAVQVLHQPAAHTDGDSIVFFRHSDVISTGDVFVTTTYPYIDVARGGSIQGIIDALNQIIALTIPADRQEGGTMVIPGHGRLCDEADVVEYRDMLTIIRDRIQHMVDENMSLRQVQTARPTLDYDGRYGAESGDWTTEQFVETVYLELNEGS